MRGKIQRQIFDKSVGLNNRLAILTKGEKKVKKKKSKSQFLSPGDESLSDGGGSDQTEVDTVAEGQRLVSVGCREHTEEGHVDFRNDHKGHGDTEIEGLLGESKA